MVAFCWLFSPVLSAVAQINQSVEVGNPTMTMSALRADDAHITNLDEECQDRYHKSLASLKAAKPKVELADTADNIFS